MTDRFRYLEKFTGKYRVKPFLDIEVNDFPRDENGKIDSTYEDLYIPCRSKMYIVHTYRADYELGLWILNASGLANNVEKSISEVCKDYLRETVGVDNLIYFHEKDLDSIAPIVKASTYGAGIKWNSKRNIKKGKK